VSVAIVRVVFVVLTVVGGVGLVLYVAFWAVLPLDTQGSGVDVPSARTSDTTRLLALAAVAVGVALLLTALNIDIFAGAVIPVIVAIFGAALIWRQTDDERRDEWSAAAGRAALHTVGTTAAAGRWRVVIGTGLVALALVAVLASHTNPAETAQGVAIALLLIGGVALVAFPWVYRIWRQQSDQRRELIRAEERAEVAAHVHDSVLQTLTLIQRYADDPNEVLRLSRAEERALRSWLYTPTGDPDRTFAAAITRDAAEVEIAYDVDIEVVTVGDAVLDGHLGALTAATREAMLNAARHAGGAISVYAELRTDAVDVFVRDRGTGFDPTNIPADRHGVRESLIGRMERNGGLAAIRSTIDVGTEVHLHMPVNAPIRTESTK
jgi:signal transduction histidine kinase